MPSVDDSSPGANFLRRQQQKAAAEKHAKPTPLNQLEDAEDDLDDSDSSDDADADARTSSTKRLVEQVWKSHDSGTQALSVLGCTSSHMCTSSSIIFVLVTLLPVKLFAPRFTKWKVTPTTSLPVFVATFKAHLPSIHSAIVECAHMEGGTQARAKLKQVVANVFGVFGDSVHSAFVYAVMIFVWCTEGSPILSLVLRFVDGLHVGRPLRHGYISGGLCRSILGLGDVCGLWGHLVGGDHAILVWVGSPQLRFQ